MSHIGSSNDLKVKGKIDNTYLLLIIQACHLKQWSLIRHTSGMLRKSIGNLDQVFSLIWIMISIYFVGCN